MKTTIGGDRLGSGNKQEISLKNYERSTHDLGYIWRSSMSCGTLVPFMSELALPGDTFDIDLNCNVLTLPTIGPLFGSYKVQLDVFLCPIRLYQGQLHMNMLNIGMDMANVKLPQVFMASYWDSTKDENQQINPSSIWAYLGIRGLGRRGGLNQGSISRHWNAIPYLGYWDIYKQYYANKQEERGFVIHNTIGDPIEINTAKWSDSINTDADILNIAVNVDIVDGEAELVLVLSEFVDSIGDLADKIKIEIGSSSKPLSEVFTNITMPAGNRIVCTEWKDVVVDGNFVVEPQYIVNDETTTIDLQEFPLENIDNMRKNILANINSASAYIVNGSSDAPYGLSLEQDNENLNIWAKELSQEGLGIKTYQSDLFNNWISTEWIDGTNGINEVTAVSTAGDEFTIDALNLANKVYNMLNRIAISGGSYDDWLDAVYTHDRAKSQENPVYLGSLIKELSFEEVINTSEYEGQPLGTLAGRGRMTDKNKGGHIKAKVNEPSYVMGIVSITPRIDYSQGNKWDMNLGTMDDLHKPALDEIGYQDLITDQMAWFDTTVNSSGVPTFLSAGKQPAWINYMTNVNKVFGNFAIESSEMFMTLNRKYEYGSTGIEDLTTYIDPRKYNQIFADANLDSQNFWVQIGVKNTARRKMSAKQIPNL